VKLEGESKIISCGRRQRLADRVRAFSYEYRKGVKSAVALPFWPKLASSVPSVAHAASVLAIKASTVSRRPCWGGESAIGRVKGVAAALRFSCKFLWPLDSHARLSFLLPFLKFVRRWKPATQRRCWARGVW
jgi:hypothetical protein